MALHLSWEFLLGILGIICSGLVCLSRLETAYRICKKKTSEGFQSVPHVIALFNAMLRLFYATFQKDTFLLTTINSLTFLMEIGYLSVYLLYATKKDRIQTCNFLLLFNIFGFGLIAGLILFLTQGETRVEVLGWICMVFSLCVFVAPLFIVREVIKIKSVEYIPFFLSFFLTLSAVTWFGYGYLKKDQFITIPNILGVIFGILQMVLYMMYRSNRKMVIEAKLPEMNEHIVDVEKMSAAMLNSVVPPAIGNEVGNQEIIIEMGLCEERFDTTRPKEEVNSIVVSGMKDT